MRKPNVGDIYYDDEFEMKLVVTFEKYGMFWGLWETGQSFGTWHGRDFIRRKYLGMSKADIKQLFEVDDERSK